MFTPTHLLYNYSYNSSIHLSWLLPTTQHLLMDIYFKHWHTFPLCYKLFPPINIINTVILHFCPSLERISHMWLSLRFLSPVNRSFFGSFSYSFWGQRMSHLVKPHGGNCDLWIWAIQIKFDGWIKLIFAISLYLKKNIVPFCAQIITKNVLSIIM